jgi:hypothetical protein
MRRPMAERVSPSQRSTLRPITRSSDAVAKPSSSAWPMYQRVGAPHATAKPSLSNRPRIASKRAPRLGLAESEQVGVEHRRVIAAEQPVCRRHPAPGQLADGDAVAARRFGGEGQGAVARGASRVPRRAPARAAARSCPGIPRRAPRARGARAGATGSAGRGRAARAGRLPSRRKRKERAGAWPRLSEAGTPVVASRRRVRCPPHGLAL